MLTSSSTFSKLIKVRLRRPNGGLAGRVKTGELRRHRIDHDQPGRDEYVHVQASNHQVFVHLAGHRRWHGGRQYDRRGVKRKKFDQRSEFRNANSPTVLVGFSVWLNEWHNYVSHYNVICVLLWNESEITNYFPTSLQFHAEKGGQPRTRSVRLQREATQIEPDSPTEVSSRITMPFDERSTQSGRRNFWNVSN